MNACRTTQAILYENYSWLDVAGRKIARAAVSLEIIPCCANLLTSESIVIIPIFVPVCIIEYN